MRFDARIQNTYWGSSHVHGVGVFAKNDLSPGETAEVCRYKFFRSATQHPLLTEEGNAHLILRTEIDQGSTQGAHIPTGHALLYNHSDEPNAELDFDEADHVLGAIATKPILKGDEILIDYAATHPSRQRGF